jgi:hypothetical protein
MRNGGSKTDEDNLAVYAELQPIDHHRSFIDHLFVLRDRGRLTGIGRNLFASPFSEIALVGRRPDDNGGTTTGWSFGKRFICRHASDGNRASIAFTVGCSGFDADRSISIQAMLRSLECLSSSPQQLEARARAHSIQSSALWMLG